MSNIDPNKARQGPKGRPVLLVLIAALVLALIAFAGMGLYGGSQPDENIGGVEAGDVETAPAAPPAGGADGATVVDPADTPPAPAN